MTEFVEFVEKPKLKELEFETVSFQEFQDTHKLDPFYYDLAGDLLTRFPKNGPQGRG